MTNKGNKGGKTTRQSEMLDSLVKSIEGQTKQQQQGRSKPGATKAGQTKKQAQVAQMSTMHDPAELEKAWLMQKQRELMHREAIAAAQYVNEPIALKDTNWFEVAPGKFIRYEQFNNKGEFVGPISDLFTEHLTEPYSTFTYEYFYFGWPDLAILAFGHEGTTCPAADFKGEMIGAVVSRVIRKGPNHPLRGYVAMLAVKPSFRGVQLGSKLVVKSVELMKEKGCDHVYLETPIHNERALQLYTQLGFVKTKYLFKYYLDGADAVRLVLFLKPAMVTSDADVAAGKGNVPPNAAEELAAVMALQEAAEKAAVDKKQCE